MQLYQLLFPNNKSYIGITSKTAQERFNQHCESNKNYLVNKAIKKYGKNNIKLLIIGECNNLELLCLAEREAIEKFNTKNPHGYNLTEGGEGSLGYKHSLETKEKISIASKSMNKESRKRSILAIKNRTPEQKEKHLLSLKLTHTGKKVTKETRLKLSMSGMGHVVSKETREKLSISGKGRKTSEETKKILSIINSDPERIANRLKVMKEKGYKVSQETKDKMSASHKLRYERKTVSS